MVGKLGALESLLDEIDRQLAPGGIPDPDRLLPLARAVEKNAAAGAFARELQSYVSEADPLKKILLVTEAIAADGGPSFSALRHEVQRQLADVAELQKLLPLVEAIASKAESGDLPDADTLRALAIASYLARRTGEGKKAVWPVVVRLALLSGTDPRRLVESHTDLEWTILAEKCRTGQRLCSDISLKPPPEDHPLRELWEQLVINARLPEADRLSETKVAGKVFKTNPASRLNTLWKMRERGQVGDWRQH
jgi:hypothetical protein